jgi:hypothetical protein
MALDESIQKEILKLSQNKDQDGMVPYLREQLEKNKATAQEIFDYAKGYRWPGKEGKPYVMSASTINELGVMVENLENKEQKKLDIEFFKLAAERGSSWGNRNYASYFLTGVKARGIEASPEQALVYAKEAVRLAKGDKAEEHEHKLILAKALRGGRKYVEANKALMEYFLFKEKECKGKNEASRKEIEKEIDEAIELYKRILKKFKDDLSKVNVSKERILDNLQELEPLLCSKLQHVKYPALKQEAYFIKASHHKILAEFDKAMLAHCAITDEKLAFYANSISARAELLKGQVKRILKLSPSMPASAAAEDSALLENSAAVEHKEQIETVSHKRKRQDFVPPNAMPLPIHFSQSWKASASWFHSVDQKSLEAEFKKRDAQVDALIAAKKIEIEWMDELTKNTPEIDGKKAGEDSLERKKILEVELEKLEKIKEELKREYDAHLPAYRGIFRRHAAEGRFFNPDRSKKKDALIALTEAIIDQRFRVGNVEALSIELTGNSTRLLIAAEKLFQKAVVDLTGEENPCLGIPTARVKPWSKNGYSGETGYGPVEHYKIGRTTVESEHRTSPKRERLGDSFLPQHGAYDRIFDFLAGLSAKDSEKEKKLADLIIRYGKNQRSISLEELQDICEEATDWDVHTFNQICFLVMAKEQGQWHSATQETHQLGMSVAQARCLIMMKAGFLSLKEVFKNNVLFGVYSQTNIVCNPENVSKACRRIDELYMHYLQMQPANVQSSIGFFKKHIDNASKPSCVLTREQAHQDMLQVYGGEDKDESDGEGYVSDLSM